MEREELLQPDLLSYFREIADRLWSGHAAVMVGAGFSCNAKKNSSVTKSFPNWDELGDIFYEKVNCKKSTSEHIGSKESKYRNVLRLADEVQAAFGRGVLDNIIKNEIPDKEYQPSELHERLLRFPWVDVFTTNYDTLLERATERVVERRYDTVVNKEDLVYSSKPRIIKLHGSFPSERPFIITEEDYRKYPKEYAPFVNTVQQSLLENTLCLLGFSGTDPNFLQWIGWIRDNLGKENSPRIYLIGILNISAAQKKLLEQRNIIPLDLSTCHGVGNSHENAIKLFFDFLSAEGKIDNRLDWPQDNVVFRHFGDKEALSKVPEILNSWRQVREEFPNWVIVPEERRDVLAQYIDDSYIFHLSEVDSPNDIQFLYEYNWRIEKCLVPIVNDLIPHYESVINRYNPFPEKLSIENAILPKESKLDWKQIASMWVELQLSIMRNFREEGVHENWKRYNDRLFQLRDKFGPEMLARYHYERSLYALFELDIAGTRKELEQWPVNVSLPYWEARRAGLMAEIGDVSEADKVLENSLKEIRSRLNLTPVTNDYSNVSQEAYVMMIYRNIKHSSSIQRGEYEFPKDIDENFKDRWDTLVQYKCDPWLELKLFGIKLGKEPSPFKQVTEKIGFEVNEKTTTYHLGGIDKNAQMAYAYLRFVEEIGLPLHLSNFSALDASKEVIKHMANYSPFWAFTTFVRVGEKGLADQIFDRKTISKISVETIDSKIDEYLSVLKRSMSEIKKGDTFRNKTFAINLSELIPEILSRLCVKCSFSMKLKILDRLLEIYLCDYKDRFRSVKNLTKRLINSFSRSDQYAIIPKLLEFPILAELNHRIDDEYIDPFNFINPQAGGSKIEISHETVRILFEAAKNEGKERTTAVKRLVVLNKLDLLAKEQTLLLADVIWSRTDEKNGFPTDFNWYYFSYINLPHPQTVNPEELLKTYIDKIEFPIQNNDNEKGNLRTRGDIRTLEEIVRMGRSAVNFTWTSEALDKVIERAVIWWDADKHYLKKKDKPGLFGSIHEECKEWFGNLIDLYSDILGPNYLLISPSNQTELQRILEEFKEFGLEDNEAYAAFYNHLPQLQEKIYWKIYEGLFSKSEDIIRDAVRGVIKLSELKADKVNSLVLMVSEQIRNRCEVGLDSFIDVMSFFVKKHSVILNEDVFSNIQFGLNRLISETKIKKNDTAEVVNDKISIRVNIAKLTVALYNYYADKGEPIPEYIAQWKEVCLDRNEFSEIRRIWVDQVYGLD